MAHHQNAIPIIREITVTNEGETDLADVRITLTSEPPAIAAITIRIEQIIAGGRHHVATPEVRLDTSLLAAVTEAARMTFKIAVSSGDEEIAREALDLRLLPPTPWGGCDPAWNFDPLGRGVGVQL